jgi:hypothetical protein
MFLVAGETVKTLSGRLTTPFPKLNLKTNRGCAITLKKVNKWLMENALAEAIHNKNRLAELDFKHNIENPSQSDLDLAHYYLFGNLT